MKKNLILTMLACLNCVHTTHAVEKSAETQINGQDGLNKLRMQYLLQVLRKKVEGPSGSATVQKDASIKQAEILRDMIQNKAQPYMDDPQVQLMVDILGKLPGKLEALDLSTFQHNRTADTVKSQIESLAQGQNIPIPLWEHYKSGMWNDNMYSQYPALNPHIINDDNRSYIHLVQQQSVAAAQDSVHDYIEDLKKIDPNMEKQALDLLTSYWRRGVNDNIINIGNWQPDLEPTSSALLWSGFVQRTLASLREKIQSQADTDTQKAYRETILNEIIDNLLGDDQDIDTKTYMLLRRNFNMEQRRRKYVAHNRPWNDLKQATHTLLAKDPALKQMVFTRIKLADPRIQMVNTFEKAIEFFEEAEAVKKEVDRPVITEVPRLAFHHDVVKYL